MMNVLVTGCSSGIGLCAARMLHDLGYHIIATARRQADIDALQSQGIRAILLDLDDSASIRTAFDTALDLFGGRLDALFHNAAFGQPGAVEDLSRDALRAQFETNVFGTQELGNLAIAQMRRQGHGRLIYNSSVLGLVALPYRGAYIASKFALEGLVDTLRLELHGSGLHVSLIEPGPILSRFRANAFEHYRRHIDAEHSTHRDSYRAMETRLNRPGAPAPFTLPPEAVVAKLCRALRSEKPKIRYYVTFPTYLFATLKRILPGRWLDWVLRNVSDNEQKS